MACSRTRRKKRKTEVENLHLEDCGSQRHQPRSTGEQKRDAYFDRLNNVEHVWTFEQMTQIAIDESLQLASKATPKTRPLQEIQDKVGQDSLGKPEQRNGKSESNSDPFGLRGAKEAGEVNRATEKAARGGHSSKSHSKKLKSGGSKRKNVTFAVPERIRSSDEEDALQKASKLTASRSQVDAIVSSEATETGTDPSSQMDAPGDSEVTATVDEVEHTDSIAPDHPMSSVTADPNAEVDEVTQDDPKVDEVTPADHQTTTTDQTVISEEEFASPDLSSDGPLDVPSLEETPDSTTSDKAVPDSVPAAAAAAKTSGKSETTLKPLTPYEFVQRWSSVSRSSQSIEYAKLLEEIPPTSLPQLITNKLDGMMLTSIISAVDGHFIPKGLHQQGADILETLTQVQQFGMVSMFLSSAEKKSLQSIFSTLSEEGKADVEVDRLRALYGVK